MVEYRILGPLEVARDGLSADLGPPKQRALLAILLLNANSIVPAEQLIDLLWPERPPRHAAHAIQVYVSELRRALAPLAGGDVIDWHAPGYTLNLDPGTLDAIAAERLIDEGLRHLESGRVTEAGAELDQARQLWRGPPLADFVYEEFAQDDIRHLTDVWLRGTEALAQVRLTEGDPSQVLKLAEAAIREDPLRERPRELQLRALYRLDRAAEALRAYQAYSHELAEELGAEPPPALRRLHEQILVHDPALDAVRQAPRPTLNPYKGLRAFGEDDAPDFFGRETLVQRVLSTLAAGRRVVTLVGPSGSGKSSVLGAGVLPAARSGSIEGSSAWSIHRLRPGDSPTDALRAALADGGPDRRLIAIDQLEEAFDAPDEAQADCFLDTLTEIVSADGPPTHVVLALRADYYDRPLLHASFAALFEAGVVNVIPMTAAELEAAIVEPARRAGVDVEPALLAELIHESADRPGVLPLLQHLLAELFAHRSGDKLAIADYEALGGLRGALARRAEDLFGGLDAERQAATRHVLLRLVWLGEGHRALARRALVGELADLGLDPVVLSDVLRRFESERLLTFDRDPGSGATTVEVAHEALLTGWPRVAGWIDQIRLDLRRHAALAGRVQEWLAGGRDPDDLLTGSRLAEFEQWLHEPPFLLTSSETAFIERSFERRQLAEAEQAARVERERRLARGGRLRLAGFLGAALLLVAVIGYALTAWPGPAPEVALVYPGPGDNGMYDSIKRGFDDGVARFGLDAQTVVEKPEMVRDRIRRLAEQGVQLIVVGYAWSNPDVEIVARDHPDTRFLATDYLGELPNVWHPRMAFEEGSFLVGAAAALRSETGTVGVVAEGDGSLDWPYSGGFETGARAIAPETEVLAEYLLDYTEPRDPTFAEVNRAVREMYRSGADVVFYPGRAAPLGLFEAAASESAAQGRQLWAIGSHTDWFVALPFAGSLERWDADQWRDHALTSLIMRFDLGISSLLEQYSIGTPPAISRFGLAEGAFELASSGGFIDDLGPQLEELRDRVISGEIIVPPYPTDRGPPR